MTIRPEILSKAVRAASAALLMMFAAVVPTTHAAVSPYWAALAAPGRSDKDKERDARDKPAEVLAFAGFRSGMRIADVFGGGGYYSEILAHIVGPKGKVLLVNDPAYARFAAADLGVRFKDGRLAEVDQRVVPNEKLGFNKGELDAALFVMSYHDLYFEDKDGFPRIDASQFLDQIHDAIKPGGVLLIVDHSAVAGSGNAPAQTLHRIDEKWATADLTKHGFKLIKTFDGLRNPADDRSKLVFDAAIRGKTDRFVHLYRRV